MIKIIKIHYLNNLDNSENDVLVIQLLFPQYCGYAVQSLPYLTDRPPKFAV